MVAAAVAFLDCPTSDSSASARLHVIARGSALDLTFPRPPLTRTVPVDVKGCERRPHPCEARISMLSRELVDIPLVT